MGIENRTVVVPTLSELRRLREEGQAIGYQGIHIYLRYRAILQTLAGMNFTRVLGVGAGFGIFDRLLPPAIEYVGIDVDPHAVALASTWSAFHRPQWRYYATPLGECNFPTDHFDLVFVSEVIEHIYEPDVAAMLAEVHRVLIPGGYLLLSVPNHLHLRNRVRRLLGRGTVWMDPTHLREYTLREALALVQSLRFRQRAFRPAVLYFPCEAWLARVIPPESDWRRRVIAILPQVASHFIFLLQKENPDGAAKLMHRHAGVQ